MASSNLNLVDRSCRREQARSISEEASRLSAGGPSAAVQVENGGLRVGGVFIRSRER